MQEYRFSAMYVHESTGFLQYDAQVIVEKFP